MHYYHQLNYAQRKKFVRKVGLLAGIIVLITAAVVAIILIDYKRAPSLNSKESATSGVSTSTYEPRVQIFRTAYFQFQASTSWSQVLPESANDKFVYRSKRGNLIEQELVIYVNRESDARPVARVLPVSLKENSELLAGKVSEQCGKKVKATSQPTIPTVIDRVSFNCSPNYEGFNVLVGLVDGSPKLALKRPDGNTATYIIFYSNVTASPDAQQLIDIVNTFQSR